MPFPRTARREGPFIYRMSVDQLAQLQTEVATSSQINRNCPSVLESSSLRSLPIPVTPRAVPITATRLAEILALHALKLSNTSEFSEDDPYNHQHRASVSCASEIGGTGDDDDKNTLHGSMSSDPISDIPLASVTATLIDVDADDHQLSESGLTSSSLSSLPAASTDASSSESSSLPSVSEPSRRKRIWKRLKTFWGKNKFKIGRIVLVVLGLGVAVAISVVNPIVGVFILGNIGFIILASAGVGAIHGLHHNSSAGTTTATSSTVNDDDTVVLPPATPS